MDPKVIDLVIKVALALSGAIGGAIGVYITLKVRLARGDDRMKSHSDRIEKERATASRHEDRIVALERNDAVQAEILSRMDSKITGIDDKLDRLLNRK